MAAKLALVILTISLLLIFSGIITGDYYSHRAIIDANSIIADSCECDVKNKTLSSTLNYVLCCKDNCLSFTTTNYTEFSSLGNTTECWISDGIVQNIQPENSLPLIYTFYLFLINLTFALLTGFIFNVGIYAMVYFYSIRSSLDETLMYSTKILFVIFGLCVAAPLYVTTLVITPKTNIAFLISMNVIISFFFTNICFIIVNIYVGKYIKRNIFPNLILIDFR